MTRDHDAQHRLLAALVPTEELLTAYESDAEFHAVVQGLARALPAVIDHAASQVPARLATRDEAIRNLQQGGLIPPLTALQTEAPRDR